MNVTTKDEKRYKSVFTKLEFKECEISSTPEQTRGEVVGEVSWGSRLTEKMEYFHREKKY